MANEARRGAQDALFAAIQNQAENNMRSALQATEKAALLRELAEAYRLTVGGHVPDLGFRRSEPSEVASAEEKPERPRRKGRRAEEQPSDEEPEEEAPSEEDQAEEERPRRRPIRKRRPRAE